MIYKSTFKFLQKVLLLKKDVALCNAVNIYPKNSKKLLFSNHLKYFFNHLNQKKTLVTLF